MTWLEEMTRPDPPLLRAALAWHDAGLCVVPAKADGSKAPFSHWEEWQTARPTPQRLRSWLSGDQYDGLGIICGEVSGNIEMFEFEGRAMREGVMDIFEQVLEHHGHTELWQRVVDGYSEQTPSGGRHYLLRVEGDLRRNKRLARRVSTPDELAAWKKKETAAAHTKLVEPMLSRRLEKIAQATEQNVPQVLIETRAEGGFVIVAPSGGRTHETGASWTRLTGAPASIATVTPEERDTLYDMARLCDLMPAKPEPAQRDSNGKAAAGLGVLGDEVRPGEDFAARTDWTEILLPHGWHEGPTVGGSRGWTRPGKDNGISATTGRNDGDNLYVFTTSTEFEAETPYSKFAAYTLLEHNGDFKAAARALRAAGYGSQPNLATPSAHSSPPPFDAAGSQPEGGEPDTRTPEEIAEAVHANAVRHELALLRVRHDAKIAHAAELAARSFRPPPSVRTLTDELLIPDEDVSYHIEDLLPCGGNALLTAGFKKGKTTMIGDYLRAFADDKPFLGKFKVSPAGGRVAIFNYELSPAMYRKWLRELGIVNTDRVTVLHLRGYRMPITAPNVEDWIVQWLAERECTAWIPDPFARAAVGTDENSNTEVGVWTDTVDVIKERAGVRDLILPNHTGRGEQEAGQERGRGATRLDDWADVRWILTADDQDDRFFRATGRDVDLGEERLTYNEADRSLSFGGGDRAWTKRRRLEDTVVAYIAAHPGCPTSQVERDVVGNREAIRAACTGALRGHRIRTEQGPKNATLHYANEV